jgi:hypothetical protein
MGQNLPPALQKMKPLAILRATSSAAISGSPFVSILRPVIFECDIAPLDIAGFAEAAVVSIRG